MLFLQISSTDSPVSLVLFFGTVGMLALTIGLIVFIIFHQRKVIRYQMQLQRLEQEQQKMLLNASIRLQEEERQRIAADLHDDAGPPAGHCPPLSEREPGEPGQNHAAAKHLQRQTDHRRYHSTDQEYLT